MDDLVKSITEAEEKAAAVKNDAVLEAGRIIDAAREKAAKIEADSAERCSRYMTERLNAARVQADKDYAAYIRKSEADAKAYSDGVKKRTNVAVWKIVGRITDGNS